MENENEIINEIITKMKNLEQKNDILKAFIKTHHPEIAKINDITLDVVVKATDEQLREENKQLKEQLAEKDKEYAEWKRHKLSQYNSKKNYVREVVEKQICKQVCDEIRNKTNDYFMQIPIWVLKEWLDQIEQAKESLK